MKDKYNLPLKYGCPHFKIGYYCNFESKDMKRFLQDFPNWKKDHCIKYGCPCYKK